MKLVFFFYVQEFNYHFSLNFSTAVATEHFDLSAYPETLAWFEKIKGEIPNYEKCNGAGAAGFGGWFKKAQE